MVLNPYEQQIPCVDILFRRFGLSPELTDSRRLFPCIYTRPDLFRNMKSIKSCRNEAVTNNGFHELERPGGDLVRPRVGEFLSTTRSTQAASANSDQEPNLMALQADGPERQNSDLELLL